jgi:hypothetical protein
VAPLVESNLALILFLPWFVVLGVLFWVFPRQPRTRARTAFDALSLLASVLAFLLANHWALGYADTRHGRLWPQILATSVGYGAFLATLLAAWMLRRRWLRRRAPGASSRVV